MRRVTFSIESLRKLNRPPEYLEELRAVAVEVTADSMTFDRQSPAYLALRDKYAPTRRQQAAAVARAVSRATLSAAKTTLGIDEVSNTVYHARLNVCRQCPGNHAVWRHKDKRTAQPTTVEERDQLERDGFKLHTCGPMLDSMRGKGEGTCGCILTSKARDAKEDCPLDYWPTGISVSEKLLIESAARGAIRRQTSSKTDPPGADTAG